MAMSETKAGQEEGEKHVPDAAFEAVVDEVITHYPVSKRSASLPLLHLWQEKFGHISEEAVTWIAEKLELEQIHILELVTFYPMFRQQAIGTFHIRVCRTLSCAMAGAYKTFDRFKELTGSEGEEGAHCVSSNDGKFTVEFVECLASCGSGPVVMVNDDFYENVDGEKAAELVESCQQKS